MWLLDKKTEDAIRQATMAGIHPTAEQQLELEARSFSAESGELPRILTTAGNKAEIRIEGVLTKNPNFMAMLFGGGNTTYGEIIAAIAAAEQDPAISEITMKIGNSPGGSVDGLFKTIAAIQAAKKSIHAIVEDSAQSATFGLITQADTITAANRATRFGSVGVVAEIQVNKSTVKIASTEAPKKRPDITTEEGQAIVREELDALHELFADAIATGRGTTVEDVNANFGQGATLLAEEAQKRGMIDGFVNAIGDSEGSSASANTMATAQAFEPMMVIPAFNDNVKLVDEPWDKTASERRWRDHAGVESPDDLPNKTYTKRFAFVDDKKTFGGHHFPFWDFKDGEFVNISAVRNGLSRLPQSTAVPSKDKPRVESLLRRYLDKFNEQKENGSANGSQSIAKKVPAASSRGIQEEKKAMDLNELKAQHPALYAAVMQDGIEKGTADERDRVGAFVVAGEASGDMKTALAAIKDGSSMTTTLSTQFMMAAANRGDTIARNGDDGDAAAALENAAGTEAEQEATASAALLAKTFEACGVEMEVK